MDQVPLTREVVFIGGGHAHALVLRKWGMAPVPGTRVTVINPGPTAPYSGMLPGFVAGHYAQDELEIDLVKLARFAGARLILGRALGIDRQARLIHITGHAPVFYDHASVDIGITSDMPALSGFTEHGVPAKPLGAFAARWDAFVGDAVAQGQPRSVLVIGAGVAGAELAMACAYRLTSAGVSAQVSLLEAGDQPLRDIGGGARTALTRRLSDNGVTLRTGIQIAEVLAHGVRLSDDSIIPGDMVIGAAGARPQGWLAETGLALTDGFIDVLPDLSTVTDQRIYAVGDCAHMTHAPRPKAGVFAVRQAPVLYANLKADLTHTLRKRYEPQRDYLKLISTGGKVAVADKLGLRLQGAALWAWKNRIDQKFMRKFRELPQMARPPVPSIAASGVRAMMEGPALCGGCAAKPGPQALARAVSAIPGATRPDVLMGAGDDAAILQTGGAQQVISADHFRAFTQDPFLLSRIAAVHALGDIWAMGAKPQAALATVILPAMREEMQAQMLREILQGAEEVLNRAGAALVGGHTSVGAELTVGFSVTGLLDGPARSVTGAQVGDVLVLTKPLGTGTILAAEMQGKADGRHVAAAFDSMQRPIGAAADLLTPVAHAMTDVTGYGLAGHLNTMLQTGGIGARITLADLPLLAGAEDLAAAGIRSSLYTANRKAVDLADGPLTDTPRAALLFDPQTAGGALAAVPQSDLSGVLASFAAAGIPIWTIGKITGDAGLTLD